MSGVDPETTWYGEAYRLDYGRDVSGTVIADAVSDGADENNEYRMEYFYADNEYLTFHAGESFLIAYYPSINYLFESDTPTTITLVVEAGAGSSGTFRVAVGRDPDWNLTSETLCTDDLGTFTASGAGRHVTRNITSWDNDLLENTDQEPLVFVEVLTGVVEIQQVRLRHWPIDGPSGQWVSAGSTVALPDTPVDIWKSRFTDVQITTSPEPGPEDFDGTNGGYGPNDHEPGPGTWGGFDDIGDAHDPAFSDMNEALAGMAAGLDPYKYLIKGGYDSGIIGGGYTQYWNLHSLGDPSHDFTGRYQSQMAVLAWFPHDVTYLPTTPTWIDPDRVDGDASYIRDSVTLGPARATFTGWAVLPQMADVSSAPGDIINNSFMRVRTFNILTNPIDAGEVRNSYSPGPGLMSIVGLDVPYSVMSAEGSAIDPGAVDIPIPDNSMAGIEIFPIQARGGTYTIADFSWSGSIGTSYVSQGRIINLGVARASQAMYGGEIFDPTLEWVEEFTSPPPVPLAGTSGGDTGEYVYEGDVGTGTVLPVLWFVYQKWGFLGQHFVAYGHGLGDSQPALNGKLWLGAGPPSTYPVPGEFRPTLAEWNVYPAGLHAYDGTGVMFPGTSVAPPVVDTEHQIVEFVVPLDMPLTEPTEYHLYVTNDNGTSNALSLMLYPMVDIDMEAAEPLLLTTTSGMGVYDTPETADAPEPEGLVAAPEALSSTYSPLLGTLPQSYSRISAPWVLTGRVPERAPTYLTDAHPAFTLTGGAPTTGLDDPVHVTLPVPLRYRPLDSKVTPRPDLGTGISVWDSNESSLMDWKFHYLSAPYVDAENVVPSRNGPIARPAMVFPGNAWAEGTANFPTGPRMVVAMAVTIFPDAQPRSFILSSFVSGVPDPDSFPLAIFVEGDVLTLAIWTSLSKVRIAPGYIGQRPIIIAFSIDGEMMTYIVASDSPVIRSMKHPKLTTSGLRLYLGRNNNAGSMQNATMDILDLGMDHINVANSSRLWSVVNRLDGIYGVMK